MKLKNIFKKNVKNSVASKVQAIDKKQLANVLGGAEDIGTIPMVGGVLAGAAKQTQGSSFGE